MADSTIIEAVRLAIANAAQALRALPDGELVQLAIRANEFPVEAVAVQPRPARKPRPTEKLRAEIVERDVKPEKRSKASSPSLPPALGEYLEVLELHGPATPAELAPHAGKTATATAQALRVLLARGAVHVSAARGRIKTYAAGRQAAAKPASKPAKNTDDEEGAPVKLSISSPMRTRPAPVRRVAPDLPGVPVVHLPIVDAADVRTPLDRFLCVPYSAKITGRTCVERQKAAGSQDTDTRTGSRLRTDGKKGDYACCRSCAVGQSIARRLAS